MNALSTTIVNATSAKRYELPRTRLSLYYLVGYTLTVGLALMFVPQTTMQLLFSNHVYDDLGLRIGGVFLFAIGLIVAGMIIREKVARLYSDIVCARFHHHGTIDALHAVRRPGAAGNEHGCYDRLDPDIPRLAQRHG